MADQKIKQDIKDDKKTKLAQQLRQNLKRRKSQSRALRHGKADQTSGLPAASGHSTQDEASK